MNTTQLSTAIESPPVDELAAAIKARWRAGEAPDLGAALAEYPELLAFKSTVVELAYEQYCLLEQRDAAPDVTTFCEQMPAYQNSIRNVVQVHQLLANHPELLERQATAWPENGDRFNDLQILGELGRGTFARGYLAYDAQTDRLCVLKLSPTHGGEGRTLGPLKHPHITEVYWAKHVDGLNAVCMPFLGVATLEQVRRRVFQSSSTRATSAGVLLDAIEAAPLTSVVAVVPPTIIRRAESYVAGVVSIVARIADALAYLHSQKVEHGDLKPSNIVLGPGGHPYLIDFNLVADENVAAVGGTMPYMAPEQLRVVAGETSVIPDPLPADVYSFGLILSEVLTGRVPPTPPEGMELKSAATSLLVRREKSQQRAWPTSAPVPEAVASLVDRCLATEPYARPSAAEVARTLSLWLADNRGESRPRPQRRLLAPALAVMGLALVLAGAWSIIAPKASPNPDSAAAAKDAPPPPPFQLAREPKTAEEYFTRGQMYLQKEQVELAFLDFTKSAELERKPRTLAFVAYCASRSDNRRGVDLGLAALEAGEKTAAVYNNIGRSYYQLKQFEKAIDYLSLAIEKEPNSQAARYNRALTLCQLEQAMPSGQLHGLDFINDIEAALAGPIESHELYFHAARMYALRSKRNPEYVDLALDWLRKAACTGSLPTRFATDPDLVRNLGHSTDFRAICAITPTENPPKPPASLRFVEPK